MKPKPKQQATRATAPTRSSLPPAVWSDLFVTIRKAIAAGKVVAVVYFGYLAVASLSGHTTSVLFDIAVEVVADIKFVFALTLAGSAAIWAVIERSIRKATVARLHPRIKELEKQVDPTRSSSGLNRTGDNIPSDKEAMQ